MGFKLDKNSLKIYDGVLPFHNNPLGEIVYQRTYSRIKDDGTKEKWNDTIERVINGCYSLQKKHMSENKLRWDEDDKQIEAQDMYDSMFKKKFLCGRGLWAMGTKITEERGLYEALNNCTFISTSEMWTRPSLPYKYLLNMSMLGIGCGFDTRAVDSFINVNGPDKKIKKLVISDDREGWVNSVGELIDSYFYSTETIEFDYSKIRKGGSPIKTFGGVSSGPEPLEKLHENIRKTLDNNLGKSITVTTIVDIMNHIGCCVVSGNIRRTAEMAIGDAKCEEFLNLKNYKLHPERVTYGWTSNNTVACDDNDVDYDKIASLIATNGEPGVVWLQNCKAYGRMCEEKEFDDIMCQGLNPCGEVTLESFEFCNICDVFISACDDMQDFFETLKYAMIYCKTVSLGKSKEWPEVNQVMLKNRRLGISISGITDFLATHKLSELQEWCELGYHILQNLDETYSKYFCVRKSIKMTCIKPSGTISLIAGCSPGMHFNQSQYYIRRIRLSINSDILPALQKAGYHVEPCVINKDTMIVEIPVRTKNKKTISDVSMWEQLNLAAFLQKYWADNSVSCTVTFSKYEEKDLATALQYYQYQLKNVSFLPRKSCEIYQQMPYEEITFKQYVIMMEKIEQIIFNSAVDDAKEEQFCNNDSCSLKDL